MVDKANSNMLFANFNQDFSCVCCSFAVGELMTDERRARFVGQMYLGGDAEGV